MFEDQEATIAISSENASIALIINGLTTALEEIGAFETDRGIIAVVPAMLADLKRRYNYSGVHSSCI